MSIRTRISSLLTAAREAVRKVARRFSRKAVSPSAPVPVEAAAPAVVPVIPEPVHVVPAHDLHSVQAGRSVDLVAMLRDVDFIFPQIAIKPSSTLAEIHHNAGQRELADWLRHQYLARGKQAGSMSKPLSI